MLRNVHHSKVAKSLSFPALQAFDLYVSIFQFHQLFTVIVADNRELVQFVQEVLSQSLSVSIFSLLELKNCVITVFIELNMFSKTTCLFCFLADISQQHHISP